MAHTDLLQAGWWREDFEVLCPISAECCRQALNGGTGGKLKYYNTLPGPDLLSPINKPALKEQSGGYVIRKAGENGYLSGLQQMDEVLQKYLSHCLSSEVTLLQRKEHCIFTHHKPNGT